MYIYVSLRLCLFVDVSLCASVPRSLCLSVSRYLRLSCYIVRYPRASVSLSLSVLVSLCSCLGIPQVVCLRSVFLSMRLQCDVCVAGVVWLPLHARAHPCVLRWHVGGAGVASVRCGVSVLSGVQSYVPFSVSRYSSLYTGGLFVVGCILGSCLASAGGARVNMCPRRAINASPGHLWSHFVTHASVHVYGCLVVC